jgi:hypothetical protein
VQQFLGRLRVLNISDAAAFSASTRACTRLVSTRRSRPSVKLLMTIATATMLKAAATAARLMRRRQSSSVTRGLIVEPPWPVA